MNFSTSNQYLDVYNMQSSSRTEWKPTQRSDTSLEATPIGSRNPWCKSSFQMVQRCSRQHSPPSDSPLDHQNWHISLTLGTACHSLYVVRDHKASNMPQERWGHKWGSFCSWVCSWFSHLQQNLLASLLPAQSCGLLSSSIQALEKFPCRFQWPSAKIIVTIQVNRFPQSEFNKFENSIREPKNDVFRPKDTILAKNYQLCLNVAETLSPPPYNSSLSIQLKVPSL